MRRRVVVTGMGAVYSNSGNTVTQKTWEAYRAGKCGIGLTQQLDDTQHKIKISAEVKNLSVEEYLDKKTAQENVPLPSAGYDCGKTGLPRFWFG